jgi:hypothetical protein
MQVLGLEGDAIRNATEFWIGSSAPAGAGIRFEFSHGLRSGSPVGDPALHPWLQPFAPLGRGWMPSIRPTLYTSSHTLTRGIETPSKALVCTISSFVPADPCTYRSPSRTKQINERSKPVSTQ